MAKRNSLQFTDTDLDAIGELLRIAQASLLAEADDCERRHAGVSFIEYLRRWAERAADLREVIDAR